MTIKTTEFNARNGALIGTSNANYLQLLGNTSGNAVQLNALGSDANISITLNPKGTGTVNIPTGTLAVVSGTANGILYLNGSGVVTSSANLTYNGTNVVTTGSVTATAFIPSSGTVPTNGLYLPTTNTVGFSTNSTERLRISAGGVISTPDMRLDSHINFDYLSYFSQQKFIENGVTGLVRSVGTDPTFITLNDSTVPFSKVMNFAAYYDGYVSEFIPIQPGDVIYTEVWAYRANGATGTAGALYLGMEQYDKDKAVISSNAGLSYTVSGVTVPTTGVWTKYSGTYTAPLTHTVYSGSDGGPVRYIRPRLLVNYNNGTITTYVSGVIYRKVNITRDSGDLSINGNLGIGGTTTLSSGTANGVAYLNGSKVLTTGSALTFDGSAQLTLTGTTTNSALSIKSTVSETSLQNISNDGYLNMTGTGGLIFRLGSGYAEQMRLTSTGLGIGTSSPASSVHAVSVGNTTAGSKAFQFIGGTNTGDAGGEQYGLYVSQAGARYNDQTAIYAIAGTNANGTTGTFGTNYYGVKGVVSISTQAQQAGRGIYGSVDAINWNYGRLNAGVQGVATGGSTSFTAQYPIDSNSGAFGGHFVSHGKSNSIGVYADAYLDASPGSGAVAVPLLVASNGVEKMRIDSAGNLGLGVTPSAWSGVKAFELAGSSHIAFASSVGSFDANAYYVSGTGYLYKTSDYATQYQQNGGQHRWFTAPSGTAGATTTITSGQSYTVTVLGASTLVQWQAFFSALVAIPTVGQVITATATGTLAGGGTVTQNITFNQAMTLDASGNLGIGTTSITAGYLADIAGKLIVRAANLDTNGLVVQSTTGTNAAFMRFINTGGNYYLGVDNSTGTRGFASGGSPYGFVMNVEGAYPIIFGTSNTERARIDTNGVLNIKPSGNGATQDYIRIAGSSSTSTDYHAIGNYNVNELFIQANTYTHILRGYAYTTTNRKQTAADTVILIDNNNMFLAYDKGNVNVGYTADQGYKLAVNGNSYINGNLTVTGTISASSSINVTTDVTISGNLTVNGTTTTINSNTVTVDDKNLELGSVISGTISTTGTVGTITGTGPWTATITGMSSTTGLIVGSTIAATAGTGTLYGGTPTSCVVASIVSATSITYTVTGGTIPTAGTVTTITTTGNNDTTASGGGITLKGTTDKSIIWDATNGWVSSEILTVGAGKQFKVVGAGTLGSTQAVSFSGSAPVNSLTLDASGNLGVGISPVTSYKVAINGDYWQGNGSGLVIGTLINNAGWYELAGSSNVNGLQFGHAVTQRWMINSSEQMRLTSTGLGIGTSSPSAKLTVKPNSAYLNVTSGRVDATNNIRLEAAGTTSTYLEYRGYLGHIWDVNTTEVMRLDYFGNLGLGVTPSAWGSSVKAIQIGAQGSIASTTTATYISNNWVQDASANKYIATNPAGLAGWESNVFKWYQAASGTAGSVMSFTQAMTLDASGTLLVGATSNTSRGGTTTNALFYRASGTRYIDIQTSATDTGGLLFSDGSSGAYGSVQYDHASDSMALYTNGSERMRLDSSGNLGIGTSSPLGRLQVTDPSTANGTIYLGNATYNGYIQHDAVTTGAMKYFVSSASGGGHIWYRGSTEFMRIDSSGNLGLGVTPKNTNTSFNTFEVRGNASLYGEDGYYGTIGLVQNGYSASGSFGWKYIANQAAARYEVGGQAGKGTHAWFTAPSGTAGTAISFTQAMTLDASGRLQLGTTTANGILTVQQAAGKATFDSNGSYFTIELASAGNRRAFFGYNEGTAQWQLNNVTSGGVEQSVLLYDRTSAYLSFGTNGSERARLDSSGNLSLGVTIPSNNVTGSLFIGANRAITTIGNGLNIASNYVYNSGDKYVASSYASMYSQYNGAHIWQTAPSGTAGAAISFTQAMTLDASGNLLVGDTAYRLSGITAAGQSIQLGSRTFIGTTSTGDTALGGLSGSNYSAFYSGGSAQMWLTGTGLGIGTSSPQAKLHTKAGAVTQGGIVETSGANAFLSFADVATSSYTRVQIGSSGNNLVMSMNGTTAATLDSAGNLGLGVTPSVNCGGRSLNVGNAGTGSFAAVSLGGAGGDYGGVGYNLGWQTTTGSYKYLQTDTASWIQFASGGFKFFTAPSGTAGAAITFTQAMTLDASGNLGIGETSPSTYGKFVVKNTTGRHFYISNTGLPYARFDDNTATAGYRILNYGITGTDQGGVVQALFSADGTSSYAGGSIKFGNSGLYSATATTQNSYLAFSTAYNGSDGERVRIDNSGNVGIGTTTPTYKLHVVGSFAATTKSFVIDHPTKEGMKLRYGSLESPYHGIRLTGEATIKENSVVVNLPEYIHALVKQEGSQVQITNIKHGKVLWVDEIDIENNCFTIAFDRDVNDNKEYSFYWSFTAIRKDVEDMIVEF